MRKVVLIILSSLIMLGMVSCEYPIGLAEEKQQEIVEFEPLNPVVDGHLNIYLIVKELDSDYWEVLINGAKDAGAVSDVNVYFSGTTNETDWEGQLALIDRAVQEGADGIIISVNDSMKLTSKLADLQKQNIPVVLVDTAVNEDVFDICYMTDNFVAGQEAAKEMLLDIKEKGYQTSDSVKVGVLVGSSTAQTVNERLAGFYQYWAENAPRRWSIMSDIKNCNGDNDYSMVLADNLITENPGIVGLYGTNNGPTKALCSKVKEYGRDDLIIIGFDYSDEMKTMIEDEKYAAATMLQRQYDMGYEAVGAVKAIEAGEKLKYKFVDTGVITVKREYLSNADVVDTLKHY